MPGINQKIVYQALIKPSIKPKIQVEASSERYLGTPKLLRDSTFLKPKRPEKIYKQFYLVCLHMIDLTLKVTQISKYFARTMNISTCLISISFDLHVFHYLNRQICSICVEKKYACIVYKIISDNWFNTITHQEQDFFSTYT